MRYCEERGLAPHPARFPTELSEYFVRILTEPGDFVVDSFGGSFVTGEECERTIRSWACVELLEEYCEAALARFIREPGEVAKPVGNPKDPSNFYHVPRPGILWNGGNNDSLLTDGGRKRRPKIYMGRDGLLGK